MSQLEEKLREWGIYLKRIEPSQWEEIAGMDLEKQLIQEKIVLPLQFHQLAAKHGVTPPRGILPLRATGHRKDLVLPGHRRQAGVALRGGQPQ